MMQRKSPDTNGTDPDPDDARIDGHIKRLLENYSTKPHEDFRRQIHELVKRKRISLYVAVSVAGQILDQKDTETVRSMVDCLHANGHDHPLLVEIDALSWLLLHRPKEAISVLKEGLAKWERPYLKSLQNKIEAVEQH